MKPVVIFLGEEELQGWTEMSLNRSKSDLTGSLEISLFFAYMPSKPVLVNATKNKEIKVYIGGHLAFFGKVDKRQGTGSKHGARGTDSNKRKTSAGSSPEVTSNIGADEYTVKITARGKTKYLADSSHQHATTNMIKPTNKSAIEKLIEPWKLDLDWKATTLSLDKVRFRDGALVVDEIRRLCVENGHFAYETRDGKLRVTDDTGQVEGEPLVLGENVMTFTAEQNEGNAKSKVKVKGQRTAKNVRGRKAIDKVEKEIKDAWVEGELPYIVQHFGDATPEALERRANFETNKRSSESKKLTINVFHVQDSTGEPWDIGTLHYCEIPPEGIFDVFEVTELTYNVQNDDKISTTLTLSPPPSSTAGGGTGAGAGLAKQGLSGLGGLVEGAGSGLKAMAASRKAEADVSFAPGQYPAPWTGPDVSIVPIPTPDQIAAAGIGLLGGLAELAQTPVATLPIDFGVDK